MNRCEFKQWAQNSIILLDGATGSNLIKAGMPVGACPEMWCIENKEVLRKLQQDYVEAGTNILYAPTFTANKIKLKEYNLEKDVERINSELVTLSKEAASGKAFVAVDVTMTGRQLYPVGDLQFEELFEVYKEQITYAVKAGADLIVVETMMSLAECRVALLAARQVCDLPVMITLTFNEDGRTLFGTNPETAAIVLSAMGVDAIGANCSTGPDMMIDVVKKMNKYAKVPVIAKPNAGLPKLVDGKTVYDMQPLEFGEQVIELIKSGASIVGGCCGTTPKHIKAIKTEIEKCDVKALLDECNSNKKNMSMSVLTTERNYLPIDIDGKFLVIGERINPTGKKNLQAELREGKLDLVMDMASSQIEAGADILDINVGMNGIDEEEMMIKVVNEVSSLTDVPLCIDSSDPQIIEKALRIYPGRALINSISFEENKIKQLLPAAKKYGAMFILLPLSKNGLPKDVAERKMYIDTIIEEARKVGLSTQDIIVDGLVNTVGAKKEAALETLETIRYCKEELKVATTCGLSNISFGLPQRPFVNTAFLAFAIKEGLTMAIANPSQDMLMNTAYACDMLKNLEGADTRYIDRVATHPIDITSTANVSVSIAESDNQVVNDVIKGNKRKVVSSIDQKLKEGVSASEIVEQMLIPAINQVGDLFEEKKYFLPQLIASAETMKIGVDYLEPQLISNSTGGDKTTIVIATVEGDVHDIGKNLVTLMLKNYGYNVIDLGKDVSAQKIISEAKNNNAKVICLSALMTTTMMEMKNVVEMAKKEIPNVAVVIGGAVTTQNFADEIGADGYASDAKQACEVIKSLI